MAEQPSSVSILCIDTKSLRRKAHLIQPHVIGIGVGIQIHLESRIDLFQVPTLLIVVIGIHVIGLPVHGQGDVVDLIADALHIPGQVVPGICGKRITGNGGGPPHPCLVIPNIPPARGFAFEVTLRSPNPALRIACSSVVVGLVQVELKSLRRIGIVDPEIQIVGKRADAVSPRDGIEIQVVGIPVSRIRRAPGALMLNWADLPSIDGEAIPSVMLELGTFLFPAAQSWPARCELAGKFAEQDCHPGIL